MNTSLINISRYFSQVHESFYGQIHMPYTPRPRNLGNYTQKYSEYTYCPGLLIWILPHLQKPYLDINPLIYPKYYMMLEIKLPSVRHQQYHGGREGGVNESDLPWQPWYTLDESVVLNNDMIYCIGPCWLATEFFHITFKLCLVLLFLSYTSDINTTKIQNPGMWRLPNARGYNIFSWSPI